MTQGWIQNSMFCLLLLITCSGGERKRKIHKHSNLTQVRLLHSLLDEYEKDLRPVKNWEKCITVYIDIVVYAILRVDEKEQLLSMYWLYNRYWMDEFLSWDPLEYDNITLLSFLSDNVWIPDVHINEFVDSDKSSDYNFIYVKHTGLVNYQKTIKLSAMCMFNISVFPFDEHTCTLNIQSQLHTVEHINVSMWRAAEDMIKDLVVYFDKGEWELLSVNHSYKLVDEHGDKFGVVLVYITFRRHPMYYVVNLIIPSAFLIIMDLFGFYLPPESGERISFKITLLLGYSVFLIIVSENLPAMAQRTSLIELYFLFCMVLLVISTIESIFIVRIANRKNIQSKVPKWMKKLILEKMSILLCMKDKSHYFQSDINSSDTLQEMETTSTDELSKYSEKGKDFKISTATISMKGHPEILQSILNEIMAVRHHLEKEDDQETSKEWLFVGYVLDKFFFWVYLITIVILVIGLTIRWSHHYL